MASMARGFVLTVLAVVVLGANAVQYQFDDELVSIPNVLEEANARTIFEQWSEHHQKGYSKEESAARFPIFWERMKHVHAHNSKEGTSYKMGINRFADLTEMEASSMLGGHIPPQLAAAAGGPGHTPGEDLDSSATCGFSASNANFSVPVDWRDHDVLQPVKNQGACGSCWAYSTTASVEAITAIMTGEKVHLSEQELCDCNIVVSANVQSRLGSHCDGGNLEEGFKWVVANGMGTIAQYPYNNEYHTNLTCNLDNAFTHHATIDNYEMVPHGEENLRKAITISPVSIGIDAFQADFMAYKGGIYDGACKNGIDDLDHAVSAVGFGEEGGVPYFVIRNSWTDEWGEDGYIRIKAGEHHERGKCGIAMLVIRPVKDGSVQYHVNGTWPDWAKRADPSKHDVPTPEPGPVNPDIDDDDVSV